MIDPIERQEAIDVVTKHYRAFDNDLLKLIVYEMKRLPSAQPEIVKCKDCKFYTPMNRETKTGICRLLMHQNFGDDWYCAGAERLEE